MFERTCHRLGDLNRKAGRRIVGKPVVLTGPIGEFCLQKKIGARDNTRAIGGSQPLSNPGFEVMPTLICRVDAPKAHPEGGFDQSRSAVFLPCGAVEKIANGRRLLGWHRVILPRTDEASIRHAEFLLRWRHPELLARDLARGKAACPGKRPARDPLRLRSGQARTRLNCAEFLDDTLLKTSGC